MVKCAQISQHNNYTPEPNIIVLMVVVVSVVAMDNFVFNSDWAYNNPQLLTGTQTVNIYIKTSKDSFSPFFMTKVFFGFTRTKVKECLVSEFVKFLVSVSLVIRPVLWL